MSVDAIFVARDLLVISQLEMLARQAARTYCSLDEWPGNAAELAERLSDQRSWLVADLRMGSVSAEIIAQLKQSHPLLTLCAFGPHVQHELLNAARTAGFQEVWPRSQIESRLSALWRDG